MSDIKFGDTVRIKVDTTGVVKKTGTDYIDLVDGREFYRHAADQTIEVIEKRTEVFEEGCMYVDVTGQVFVYVPTGAWDAPWVEPGRSSRRFSYTYPDRPLRKLVPETSPDD